MKRANIILEVICCDLPTWDLGKNVNQSRTSPHDEKSPASLCWRNLQVDGRQTLRSQETKKFRAYQNGKQTGDCWFSNYCFPFLEVFSISGYIIFVWAHIGWKKAFHLPSLTACRKTRMGVLISLTNLLSCSLTWVVDEIWFYFFFQGALKMTSHAPRVPLIVLPKFVQEEKTDSTHSFFAAVLWYCTIPYCCRLWRRSGGRWRRRRAEFRRIRERGSILRRRDITIKTSDKRTPAFPPYPPNSERESEFLFTRSHKLSALYNKDDERIAVSTEKKDNDCTKALTGDLVLSYLVLLEKPCRHVYIHQQCRT